MHKSLIMAAALAIITWAPMEAQEKVNIGKSNITLQSDRLTPEGLWAMGRIGAYAPNAGSGKIVYQVGYYSVKENRSHHVCCIRRREGRKSSL